VPARSRSKNGVASLAYVAGIHGFPMFSVTKDVDGRGSPAVTFSGCDVSSCDVL